MTEAALKNKNDMTNIPFIDLNAQRARIEKEIDKAVLGAVHGGAYIMGPQVKQLEKDLAEFAGAKHCISCSSGTDSLLMFLMSQNLKQNDVVFVPDFTFIATAEVVSMVGAQTFAVDVEKDTFNLDPQELQNAVSSAKEKGLNPVGVIPVDLFGHPADYEAIKKISDEHGLWIMADSAQGFGGSLNGKKVGQWGDITSTSFFPAKPLGCYGDGGALFTDNDELADVLRSLRVHGKGTDKYDNVRVGLNARLDTVQAAILIEKLKIFPDELIARQNVADRYNNALSDDVKTPALAKGATSAWAQYTLILPGNINRADFSAKCKENGVPTAVYYPLPISRQTAYKDVNVLDHGNPVSEFLSKRVISLPMHPYLDNETQDYIIQVVKNALVS